MSSATPLIEADGLAKSYGAVVALRAADLTVRAGEVHALMGANGAGKSTLVKMLTGAIRPDGGTIRVRGTSATIASPAAARRSGIVSVYQDPSLVPDLTVLDNLRLTETPPAAFREWLRFMEFDAVDLTLAARDLPLPTLRLLDLARALAAEPDVLLLDEITAALPADLTDKVFGVAREWRDRGRAVIFISHRLVEVSALCDRATVLRDGVTVGVVDPARGSEEEIVAHMLGPAARDVARAQAAPTRPDAPGAAAPAAVEVRNLRAGGDLADVSFTLRTGEVLGVAALEGQGQDALFDCLAGARRADGGEIVVGGRPRTFRHPADAIAAGLVLVPGDRLQAPAAAAPVRENIGVPLYRRLLRWGPINGRHERRRVDDAVARLQIDTRAKSQVRRLSGGNQQKVTIARWLAGGFETLLLFDPTRGIDIGTKRQIYALIRELAEGGASIIVFTSELPEIQVVCDRVVVLFGGRVVDELPGADADEPTLLRASHGLPRAVIEAGVV
jgi:ribose transport system ATP-binding protein